MNFNNTKEQFLDNCTDGDFYNSSLATYNRKVEVFFEFLTKYYGVNDNNYKEMLRGIDNIAILKSIEFYVEKYGISFRSTIHLYVSVITSYFNFLNNELNIRNENFDRRSNYSEIKKSVEEKIIELGLVETKGHKSPIVEHAFMKLLNNCDEILNTYDMKYMLENKRNGKNYPVQIFTSAIVTKLIMLTGIKNQVLNTIKLKDYNSELNFITINNFSIHLPNGLGKQMRLYVELRNSIVKNEDTEYQLFIKSDGTSIGSSYEYAFKLLQDTVGNSSAACVAKYTIMQMIKKGTNLYFIKMLTKFGIDSCLQCQELVNDEKSNEDMTSQNRYIDSKIRSMDIFDLL